MHPLLYCNHVDFNPRSRVGSDRKLGSLGGAVIISIHAPAWGATMLLLTGSMCRRHFNPRSRVGSDFLAPEGAYGHNISIHAPAWGATSYQNKGEIKKIFQSTLPRGERRSLPPRGRMGITFQSTLPRGERLSYQNKEEKKQYFNPRSRVGSDSKNA